MYIYIYISIRELRSYACLSLSVRWCFRRNYVTTALRPSREQVHSLNLVFIIARFRANGVFNSARRRGKIVEIFAVYTFEIPDSLFHQFTRRFRHRSVIRSFMACKACSLARETRRIEGYSNRFVGYRNRPFFFFFSSVATRIEIRLWYFPSTFFLLFYPVYFPSYSPFYFFTCLLFVFFFISIRRSVLWSSLFGHVHIFLFFPVLFSFFSSPPFSLFIDRVALMPHSSPIGVKYGLAIGT